MFYEVTSKRIGQDKNGNDKELTEKYLVENCVNCGEAESKVLDFWNTENTVTSVRESKIYEFINERTTEDTQIFLSVIEADFMDDNGNISTTKYSVGVFATDVVDATNITIEYMKQGLSDMQLTSVRKTKIVELLK